VIALDQLREGRGRSVAANGRRVALFRVGAQVHALDDSCPHAGASLAGGRVQGGMLACPAHGLAFELRSGCMRAGTLAVRTYAVRVVDGRVWLQAAMAACASLDKAAP